MELNKKSRRALRLQGWSFTLLFLAAVGLIAFLSTRYHVQADWTASNRHTLAPASVELLKTFQDPVTLTAFARDTDGGAGRKTIAEFIGRYQRHNDNIALHFINPDLAPAKVREFGVTLDGEIVVDYQGRRENVRNLNEQELTNALQRLARSSERQLVFVQGHGERKPEGQANHDLGSFGQQLASKGILLSSVTLAHDAIPEGTAALVVAGPQVDLLPGEVERIRQHVANGGNLLWLIDTEGLRGLKPVADLLGLSLVPGMIVDPAAQMLGIGDPTFAVIADYPPHPITDGLDTLTLFPTTVALQVQAPAEWDLEPLLRTIPSSWSETGAISGAIRFDQGKDVAGPLNVGVALSRTLTDDDAARTQRVVVIGDGDFLANSFIGNGANLDLGHRLVNWLSHDDAFINIPARAAPDVTLELSSTAALIISVFFLLLLPALLLGSGVVIWHKRRRR